MNKLISTDLNGFPFVLDDLRFIDNGIRDSFKGIHSMLLNSFYVNDGFLYAKGTPQSPALYGGASSIEFDMPGFPKTYCNINGEIFEIPATTLNFIGRVVGDVYCIEPDISFDPAGTKVFEDTNTHETYEIRKAKLVLKTGGYVSGTDIPVLYFNDTFSDRFIYNDEFTFLGRLATKLGVMDNTFIRQFQNDQITALQNFRNNIEGTWQTISGSLLLSRLFVNSSSDPAMFVSDVPLSTYGLGINGSYNNYLKYKKNGKTLHVDFDFRLSLPTYTAKSIALIGFDFYSIISGLNGLKNFSSQITGFEKNYSGVSQACICGNVFSAKNHPFKIGFYWLGYIPNDDASFIINRAYVLDSYPIVPVSDLDNSYTNWVFRGQFTCEID